MAALSFKQLEKGVHSFGATDTTVTITLDTPVDPSKTFVLADAACWSARGRDVFFQRSLSEDGAALTISRGLGSTPATIATVEWHVIEFNAGLTVQHLEGTEVNTSQVIPSLVDVSRTAAIISYQKANFVDGNQIAAGVKLVDSTSFIVSQAAANTISYTCQILEFDVDSGVKVEFAEIVMSMMGETGPVGAPMASATIGAVDPLKTLLIGSCQNTSSTTNSNAYCFEASLANNTTIEVARAGVSGILTAYVYAIDFGPNIAYRTGMSSPDLVFANLEDADSALVMIGGGSPCFGTRGTANQVGYVMWRGTITSLNSGLLTRGGSGQAAGNYRWQVIDFSGPGQTQVAPWPGDFRDGVTAMASDSLRAPQLVPIGAGNNIAKVITPLEQRPGGRNPISIFSAWPGMALDTARSRVVFYGGGHANYSGNEVMACDLNTMSYSRLSLPSQVTPISIPGAASTYKQPVDGPDGAPPAAHCYSNLAVLEISDRMIAGGGAAADTGGGYQKESGEPTGPYLWDMSKGNADYVGGATGTDMTEAAPGLNAWTNLDCDVNPQTASMGTLEGSVTSVVEDGKDVVYAVQKGAGGSAMRILRYVIDGPADDPASWTREVLYTNGSVSQKNRAAFAEDFAGLGERVIIAWTGVATPLIAYNVDRNEALSITPTGDAASSGISLIYDPVRGRVVGTDGDRWIEITHPATWSASGWVINTITPAQDPDYVPYRNTGSTNNVWGKLVYWREHDVFIANTMVTSSAPTMWVYKPHDWSPLGLDTGVAFEGVIPPLNVAQGVAMTPINLSAYFSGSATPFVYSVQSGTLPTGIALNSTTGVLSGTPTTPHITAIVIRATAANSETAGSNSFVITVAASLTPPQGAVTISSVTPSTTTAVVTYSYDNSDQTGFERRINGGTPAGIGASPATITGLNAGTTYAAEVRAINGNGSGAWSAPFEFETDSVAPPEEPPVGETTVTDVTPGVTTALVTYSYNDTDATGYEYRINSGSWASIGASPATITGLTAETLYTPGIQVRPVNAFGAGDPSTAFAFTTESVPVAVVKGIRVRLYSGSTMQASLSGIVAAWWDASPIPDSAPTFHTTTATTDSGGWLEIDLDAYTFLDVGDPGHLAIYKLDGTDEKDSLQWNHRLLIENIA